MKPRSSDAFKKGMSVHLETYKEEIEKSKKETNRLVQTANRNKEECESFLKNVSDLFDIERHYLQS